MREGRISEELVNNGKPHSGTVMNLTTEDSGRERKCVR